MNTKIEEHKYGWAVYTWFKCQWVFMWVYPTIVAAKSMAEKLYNGISDIA